MLSNFGKNFCVLVAKLTKTVSFHPTIRHIVKDSTVSSRLDRVDLKMLRLLQNNGRLSNAELAETAGVSPATCHRRTQRLFDEGFIARVRAMVAPRKVGMGTLTSAVSFIVIFTALVVILVLQARQRRHGSDAGKGML